MSHPFLPTRTEIERDDPQVAGRLPGPLAPADPHESALGVSEVADPILHATFPWRDVHAIAGPVLPGSLTIVSARTGSGKTLFVRNWIHHLTQPDRPGVAYFPTETPVRDVMRGIVCAELGVNPVDVARGDLSRVPGGRDGLYQAALAITKRLQTPRGDLTGPPLALYGHPRPSLPLVTRTLEVAAEQGVGLAIIDHILRLDIGDATNPFAEVTNAVRELKNLAERLGIAIVVTSQQNRAAFAGDRMAAFHAPDLSALKGAGTLEEEADLVLFLHRVLRDNLSKDERAAVRAGTLPLQQAVAPHLMGVAVGKHRLDGGMLGASCRVWVEHGRVTDLPDAERRAWDAAQHAIRTGGTL